MVWLKISPMRRLWAQRSETVFDVPALSRRVAPDSGMTKETTLSSAASGGVTPLFSACHCMISRGVR